MPETREIETISDGKGNIIERVYGEISDEELYQEQVEKDSNDSIHSIKSKLDNWDSLSGKEKSEAVKDLLTCMLNLYKGQY